MHRIQRTCRVSSRRGRHGPGSDQRGEDGRMRRDGVRHGSIDRVSERAAPLGAVHRHVTTSDTSTPLRNGSPGGGTIWVTTLLAIGLSVTGKVSRGNAAIAGMLVWILGSLPGLIQALPAEAP